MMVISRFLVTHALALTVGGPVMPLSLPPRAPADEAPAAGPREFTVDDAVEQALHNNLALLAERERVPIARAENLAARVRLNPVLTLGADHLDLLGTRYDNENKAGPQEFFVRTDFGIMTGGKRKLRKSHAGAAVTVAERELEDSIRMIVLEVQLACVDVQLARAMLDVATHDRALFAGLVELNEVRVAGGDIAEVELMRTQMAAEQAGNAVLQAEAALEVAENQLQLLLGSERPVTIQGAMRRDGSVGPRAELRATAVKNRPDLQAAQSERVRAGVDIKRQLAEGKIDLSVGIEARRQQGLAGTGNSLGVFMAVPLPTGDRNQGGVERARREQRRADAEMLATERRLLTEVDNGEVLWRSSRDRLERFEAGLLERAKGVLATVEYSYRRGEASLIELVDAQRAHNEIRRAYNVAQADHAQALYSLEAVTAAPLPK